MSYKSNIFVSKLVGSAYDRVFGPGEIAQRFKNILSTGVIGSALGTLLQVSKVADTMLVSINLGEAIIEGYHFEVYSSAESLELSSADATNPRIDRIVLELNLTEEQRKIYPKILEGTAASSPEVPELTLNTTVYQISLAKITVPAAATNLNSATLTDERVLSHINLVDPETIDVTKLTTIPLNKGGTGATTKAAARAALGITSGTADPTGGDNGDIYFKIVS